MAKIDLNKFLDKKIKVILNAPTGFLLETATSVEVGEKPVTVMKSNHDNVIEGICVAVFDDGLQIQKKTKMKIFTHDVFRNQICDIYSVEFTEEGRRRHKERSDRAKQMYQDRMRV